MSQAATATFRAAPGADGQEERKGMRVGVLALQGAFREHREALARLGIESIEIRLPHELAMIDALIIPGGESTTMGKLMERFGLTEPLRDFAAAGRPIWGTCAGMILMARAVDHEQPVLRLMDITVRRNAFGRQVDSFETPLTIEALGNQPFPAIFIRAPLIEAVGPGVNVLARLADGTIVAARQGKLLATSFHPELSNDSRLHAYVVSLVDQAPLPAHAEREGATG